MPYAKIKQDWVPLFKEFIKYLRIKSKEVQSIDERGAPLNLWGSQKKALEEIESGMEDGIRMFLFLKSRQLGMTTITLALDIFWLAYYPGTLGALVTEHEENRDKFRETLGQYIASFPKSFFGSKFSVLKDNDSFMSFNNGSRLDFIVAGRTKENWGEGGGYSLTHMTEISKYGKASGIASFRETLSQTNPNRLFIGESTAKGYNHYKKMWEEFKSDEFTKKAVFLGWYYSDMNIIKKNDRRYSVFGVAEPDQVEQQLIDEVERLYGYNVSQEQLAWYRWKHSDRSAREEDLFQNQPWCVAAGTRVGTDKGILKIEDIYADLESANGKVLHAGITGESRIWKAKTELGFVIRGTANHPLIDIDNEEIEIEKSLGKIIRLQPPMFSRKSYTVKWREGIMDYGVTITPDFARLIGLFMGDGSLSGQQNGRGTSGFQFAIACTGKDRDIVDECHRLIRSIFGVNTQERHSTPNGPQGGCIDVRVTSRLIYDTFKKLGLIHSDFGTTRRKIHVPEFIWCSPKHVVKEFLSGLFEADGCNSFKENRVVFSSKHKDFVQDVQLLLLGFGITGRIRDEVTTIKKLGKKYTSNSLTLNSLAAKKFNEDIGFLSERKQAKGCWRYEGSLGRKVKPLVFEDKIISVVQEDIIESVYNLTIENNHVFDCNGILTHNTADQAFVLTGHSYFQMAVLGKEYERCVEIEFEGYTYHIGTDFWGVVCEKIIDANRLREVTLRIWEPPDDNGYYVIGCDPAYGRGEFKNRHGISVWRAFADKIVQVAEYADNETGTRQAAWVLAHLAGAYKNSVINVEINGPGGVILTEIENLREKAMLDPKFEKIEAPDGNKNWDNFLMSAKWYLYKKPDHFSASGMKGWESTSKSKHQMMSQLRDKFVTEQIILRSSLLVKEMMNVIQDGDSIGAVDPNTDDRVFAMALAVRAWIDELAMPMLARGETYNAYLQQAEPDTVDKTSKLMNNIIDNFFKTRQEEAENPRIPPEKQWLYDRGFI